MYSLILGYSMLQHCTSHRNGQALGSPSLESNLSNLVIFRGAPSEKAGHLTLENAVAVLNVYALRLQFDSFLYEVVFALPVPCWQLIRQPRHFWQRVSQEKELII